MQEDHQFGILPAIVEHPAFLAKLTCSRKVTSNLDCIVLEPFCNMTMTISRNFCGLTKAKLSFLAIKMLPMFGERKVQPTVRTPSLL